MNPRINYEMTEEDLKELLDACKATPVMFLSGGTPMGSSPQENANRAWKKLGDKMRFDSITVQPVSGKPPRFFTAVPSETTEQCAIRIAREAEENRRVHIEVLESEIAFKQKELAELKGIPT